MKLSAKSRLMSEDILQRRKQMIETEGLQINGKITKEIFKDLYSKYGSGLDERDFAWAFLDIDELRYYNIEKGKTLEPLVLIYEYVSDNEFSELRNRLVEEYGLEHGAKVPYEQVIEMYNKFGGRLSINLFLEEVLGIKSTTLKSYKKGETKNAKINFDAEAGHFNRKKVEVPMYALNPEYIYELRKKVILEAGVRVGDSVSFSQIEELNKQFCPEMPAMLFAAKVLDIKTNSYNGMKSHKSTNPINGGAFQDVVIPEEYITQLQDTIAKLYKLESGQLLKNKEFQKLYDKYGGILSKRTFALSILDMTMKGYNDLSEGDANKAVTILNSRKKTDFDYLRRNIVRNYKFHHGDMLKYEEFRKIHQKYAPNISEFVFAEKIFGMSSPSFQCIKYNGAKARMYFELPTEEERLALQKKVIIDNNLHMNDKINYEKLQRLYEIYGGIMPIRMFAIDVLALDKQSFLRIKNHPEKDALVLFNLEIPASEIENLKEKIKFENGLQEPKALSLEEIDGLYDTYGGIMSKQMFLRKILGLSQSSYDNMRYKKSESAIVCIRGDFNEEEIRKLKIHLAEGLTDAKIAARLGVTVTVLRLNMNKLIEAKELTDTGMVYEKVKLLQSNGRTPEEMVDELEISIEEVKEMLHRAKREMAEEEERKKKEKKAQKAESNEEKRKAEIESGAIKAIDDYSYTPRSIKKVRAYIEECKKSFENGSFSKDKMEFLMECLIFVQCNCREIEMFSRMCIKFNEYKMASMFIAENLDNEGITQEEQTKLKKLRESVNYAIRKQNALKFLKMGGITSEEIAQRTGVREVDVIKLKKALEARRVSMMDGKKKPETEDPVFM